MGAYPHSPRWKLLCRRLREAREQAGYTQVQAAAAIGKQQNFVSKSETGQRRLDPIELADFASLYGTTISALVPGDSSGRIERARRVAEATLRPKRKAKRPHIPK